jgi:hypothetical protein
VIHFRYWVEKGQLTEGVHIGVQRFSLSPTLLMLGGMALPPTPMRLQSMSSPSSVKVSRPTTTPFSDATTAVSTG